VCINTTDKKDDKTERPILNYESKSHTDDKTESPILNCLKLIWILHSGVDQYKRQDKKRQDRKFHTKQHVADN
jgi:hypothetical protein